MKDEIVFSDLIGYNKLIIELMWRYFVNHADNQVELYQCFSEV